MAAHRSRVGAYQERERKEWCEVDDLMIARYLLGPPASRTGRKSRRPAPRARRSNAVLPCSAPFRPAFAPQPIDPRSGLVVSLQEWLQGLQGRGSLGMGWAEALVKGLIEQKGMTFMPIVAPGLARGSGNPRGRP